MTAAEQSKRFAFYWQTLLANPSWIAACRLIDSLDTAALDHLLRNHRDTPGEISFRELTHRLTMDEALAFVSKIPIGIIAGYYPLKLNQNATTELLKLLAHPSVIVYYEQNYRLLLPSLLRLHCAHTIDLPSESSEAAWGAFQWFSRFTLRLDADKDCAAFLNLLDGVQFGNFGLAEFKKLLGKPKDAIPLLNTVLEPRSDAQRCISGLLRFTSFCVELNAAFGMIDALPLTRSAIWFYFGYWFREQEGLARETIECVKLISTWPERMPVSQSNFEILAAAEESRQKAVAAVQNLTNERYARPLIEALGLK